MSISLKRIRATDTAIFNNIAADVFDEPVDPLRLRAYLAAPANLMVLALDGDLVVGQCAGVIHNHPDKVTELYVDEVGTATAYLRQGVATSMFSELLAWGRERGCREAWLGTERNNHAANALYRTFGGAEEIFRYYEFKL